MLYTFYFQTVALSVLSKLSFNCFVCILCFHSTWSLLPDLCNFSGPESTAWMGGTDEHLEGNWSWVDQTQWDWDSWAPGQPNNYGGQQHCLAVRLDGMHDFKCSDTYNNYICRKKP